MSFCENCGKEINQEAKFCMNCGTPVRKAIDTNESSAQLVTKETYIPQSIDSELLSPLAGEEKTFTLCGKELIVSADIDLYNAYRTKFKQIATVCSDNAVHEYLDNIHNFNTFIELFPGIYEKHLAELTKKAFDILIAEGIYNITYEDFHNQHKKDFHYALDVYNSIVESCRNTEENNNQLTSNLAEGVQSLLGSFIDKKSTHSIVNTIASGYVEGVLNQTVKEGSKINPAQKAELYNRITPHTLFNRINYDYISVFISLVCQLNEHGKSVFLPTKETAQQGKNIFTNLSNPNFNQEKIIEVLIDIIKENPYIEEYYEFMREKFGTTDEVEAIVTYFGYDSDKFVYKEEDYPKVEEVVEAPSINENQENTSVFDKLNINQDTVTSMFKTGLKFAAGAAFGSKLSSDTNKKTNSKKDLFGTAVCQRCNAKTTEMKRFTCTGCPAYSRCTRQTK